MKRFAFILVAAMFVSFFMVSCKQATPSTITADCIEYIKDGNYEAYVNTFNMNDEEKAQLKEMFEQKGKETIEKMEGVASYEIVEEKISEDGTKATVKAAITYGNGQTQDSKFHFVKVDDEWKQEMNK